MNTETTPVLVVGGALTGLSSAVFLAHQGVDVVVIERHPALLMHPRLRGLTPRAIEVLRQVGLQPGIEEKQFADPTTYKFKLVQANTLADDYVDAMHSEPMSPALEDPTLVSPSNFGPIDQDKLEWLLRDKATELGAQLRFNTELVSFEQDESGVTAMVRNRESDTQQAIRADYLIGADGLNSPVRNALGIEVDGPGVLTNFITALFHADLSAAVRGREVGIAYLQQPRPFTSLMPLDEKGHRWSFGTAYDPSTQSTSDFTAEDLTGMVRAASGLPGVDIELIPQIPGTDITVLGFAIGAQIARAYAKGRVFLVGDAGRINPPTGGLGGSTGIQDAHNLAWKLAAVLKDLAGPGLLETYDAERRPVDLLTMQQAFGRFGARMAGDAETELIDIAKVVFGYQYRSSAVLGAEEEAGPLDPFDLKGRPGTRAPHVWTTLDGERVSTLDLFDKKFVLIAGRDADAWAADADKLDVEVYRLGEEVEAAYGIEPGGAVLVRPDGFVAWRSEGPGSGLAEALRLVLSRP